MAITSIAIDEKYEYFLNDSPISITRAKKGKTGGHLITTRNKSMILRDNILVIPVASGEYSIPRLDPASRFM